MASTHEAPFECEGRVGEGVVAEGVQYCNITIRIIIIYIVDSTIVGTALKSQKIADMLISIEPEFPICKQPSWI